MFMVVIFGLGIYKTDMCVQKQLSVYTQECAVYKISWEGWAGWAGWGWGGGDSIHLEKLSRRDFVQKRDFVLVGKFTEGILSTL